MVYTALLAKHISVTYYKLMKTLTLNTKDVLLRLIVGFLFSIGLILFIINGILLIPSHIVRRTQLKLGNILEKIQYRLYLIKREMESND